MSSTAFRYLCLVLAFGLIAACASTVPKELAEKLPDAPSPPEVQAESGRYLDSQVRWGGEILSVQNRASSTEVELYGRPLSSDGEPRPDGGDGVRFVARVKGFLDPAEYQKDKRLTVYGRVGGTVTRPVGEYPYVYPVVDADVYHLWPVYQPPESYNDPWGPWGIWGGPWGPWRPYRYYPYRW
ncbi:MAG: Slp family lipoprotein [Sedimenticolaceae bacterium]